MDKLDNADLIAVENKRSVDEFAKRMSNPKLTALRAQLPFIPIMPFPNTSLSYALTADVPLDINLPSGTKLVMFSGNGEYFISRNGRAEIPIGDGSSGNVMNPEFFMWYVEEINQFSAIAPFDCRLTVHCFQQL
jgi:hypothetical protein